MRKITLLSFGISLFLLVGFSLLLQSPWGLEKVRRFGVKSLHVLMEGEGEVEIRGIEGNPFFQLTLKGIKIKRKDYQVRVDQGHFRYNLLKFLFFKELDFTLENGEIRNSRFTFTDFHLKGSLLGRGEGRRLRIIEGRGNLDQFAGNVGERVPLRILEGEILIKEEHKDSFFERFDGTTLSLSSPKSHLKGKVADSKLKITRASFSLEELRILFIPSFEMRGDVEMDGEFWWEEGDPRMRGNLTLRAEEILGVSLKERKAELALEKGILNLRTDLGDEGEVLFRMATRETPPTFEFEGDLEGLDLSEVFPFYSTKLFGKFHGVGKGRKDWKATFSFGESQIHHLTITRSEGTIEMRGGKLFIPTFWAKKEDSQLRLHGEDSREGVRYNLVTAEVELSEILPFFIKKFPFLEEALIRGKLSSDLVARGFPENPSLYGSIWVRDPQVNEMKAALLSLELQFQSLGKKLTGDGKMGVSQWKLSNRTIESLDLELNSQNGKSSYTLTSSSSEETLTLFGKEERKGEIHLFQIDTLRFLGENLMISNREPIHFTIQKKGFALTTGPLDFLEGSINLWAAYEREGKSSLVMEGDRLPLMRLGQLLQLPWKMDGEGWFNLTAQGTPGDPQLELAFLGRGFRLDSDPTLPSRFISLKNVDLDSLSLLLSHKNNRLRVLKGSLYREGMVTEITGSLPIKFKGRVEIPEEWMEFHLDMKNIGAWIFSPFRTLFDLSEGKIEGKMKIGGTPEKPEMDGELRIASGEIFIPSTATPLTRVEGRLTLARNRVLIEKVRGVSSTGWVEAKGRVDLDLENFRDKSIDIEITAEKTPFEGFSDVSALVDGQLRISGSSEKPRIEGTIRVIEGIILREFRSEEEDYLPSDFSIDFSIFAERNVWLRNSNADIELSGEVVIRGEEGRRVVSGALQAEKGELFYLDRTYRVTRGMLSFPNSTELNPSLDLEAETEIRYRDRIEGEDRDTVIDSRIGLHVTGTLLEPQFQLIPPPGISEEEILFYLTLNMPLRDIAETGVENLMSGAGNRGMVLLQRRLSRELERSTGLDALSLETQFFGKEKMARFTFGKYLFRDVYVSYSGDLLSMERNQFKVEYYLGRGTSLYGQRSGSLEEEYDMGLEYQYRY